MIVKIVTAPYELVDAFSVRKKVFVEEQKVPMDLEIDEFENSAVHFVLYDGKEPVGAGRVRELGDTLKVERICVLDTYRSKGCGKLIMEKAEEIAKEKDSKKLKLNAQTHAEGFYKKLGYETISGIFMDAGIPHVTMVKTF
ncbi:GNAT family N-acetyltransferase [Schinkia sp. CFF1]